MKFDVHLPCPQLLPYVKHIIISEDEQSSIYNVLPNTSLVIGFQYKGALCYHHKGQKQHLLDAGVTGLCNTYRTFENTRNIGTVLVVMQEQTAARIIKHPLHQLFEQSTSLTNFFKDSELSIFKERLMAATDDVMRIVLTKDFLISQLSDQPPDPLIKAALQHIHATGGTIRISELARLLNTSASPLEKRFRKEVGASPKKFATIVRARNVLSAMEQGNERYAEYLACFYDQAHFIKAFKRFAAVTPEQYLKGLK